VERQQLLGLRLLSASTVLAPTMALLLGGCSQPARSATPSPAAIAALADVERRKDAVSDLEYRLVEKCVRSHGYDVLPPRPVAIPDLSPDGRLGIDQARDVGYGLRDLLRTRNDSSFEAGATSWQAATDEYRNKVTVVMFGPEDTGETYDFGGGSISMSSSGCYTEVRKQLFGDLQTYLKYSWTASNGLQAARGAEVGGAIEELDTQWRSCMSERGLNVSSPDAARERAAAVYSTQSGEAGFRSERDIAINDAECRRSVSYDETLAELRERGAARYLASHEADVIAYSALLDDAERKGQEALRGVL
jgi:hypothetical protein